MLLSHWTLITCSIRAMRLVTIYCLLPRVAVVTLPICGQAQTNPTQFTSHTSVLRYSRTQSPCYLRKRER